MTQEAIRKVVKALGLVAFTVGGFGSALCVPYALTTDLVLIATAGIYFVAGGIMIVGGLLTYAVLIKDEA
ncbi:MAG TPA: hypothetical protein P5246_03720 [Candidatus Omnitrophota bacterium]|jgi:hypothetical protein|nr:hypothetical protein [Candidatus Omnitrophota bacterium]HSA30877.1 hypothetical protein [Candidatus Omnitrophota bacterium]